MTATELFQAGQLQAAIDEQLQAVRKDPADEGKRVFLFELLAYAGDLDRAARQLQAVAAEDAPKQAARQTYLLLLDAERKRRQVLSGQAPPALLGPAPTHVLLRLEALGHLQAKNEAAAADVLRRADEAAPRVAGTLNGGPLEGLRDLDDRFGSVLEVMANGSYYWLPFEKLAAAAFTDPKYPRDLLWAPARLTLDDGQTADVFLPALYPGHHEQADDRLRLGRATEWQQAGDGPVCGIGARTFLAGDEAVGLLDCRELTLAPQ